MREMRVNNPPNLSIQRQLVSLVLVGLVVTTLAVNTTMGGSFQKDTSSSSKQLESEEQILKHSLYSQLDFKLYRRELAHSKQNYDIMNGLVTCYLHLKTSQIQLDIDFLGTEDTTAYDKSTSTDFLRQEEIAVFGTIRNLVIYESETIEIDYITYQSVEDENYTAIKFNLTTLIPLGITRNVKISYIQDTQEFLEYYEYQLGVKWYRRIGSQGINIICDKDISLLNSFPSPHTISTTTGQKLILSWLEVNKVAFEAALNYTQKIHLEGLQVTPQKWDFGKVRENPSQLEQVFLVTNNENTRLDGALLLPVGVTANITVWDLSVGESIAFKVMIDISQPRTFNHNITLQCSLASFPVLIPIIGEVQDTIPFGIIIGLVSGLVAFVIVGGVSLAYFRFKRKGRKREEKKNKPEAVEDSINLQQWKEILTEREFNIFTILLKAGECSQADLCRETNFSKSTVSRAVGRLVAKGLVLKERKGMANQITINRQFFKKKEQ